jgi:hypothetical protein
LQHFETNPPNAATVTQYGSHTGALASTETQFGPYQMEIHTAVHVSLGNPGDSITLPLAIGQWQGSWVSAVPKFVLQIQAYDADGHQVGNGSILYDGGWDQRGTGTDAYVQTAGYYAETLGVQAWEADKPLPEPLTMLGVIAGVGGVAGYIRKRRAQA